MPRATAPGGHDNLHTLFEQGELKWCYCKCARCWRNEGVTYIPSGPSKNAAVIRADKGTCTCETCPCRKERARVNPPQPPPFQPRQSHTMPSSYAFTTRPGRPRTTI